MCYYAKIIAKEVERILGIKNRIILFIPDVDNLFDINLKIENYKDKLSAKYGDIIEILSQFYYIYLDDEIITIDTTVPSGYSYDPIEYIRMTTYNAMINYLDRRKNKKDIDVIDNSYKKKLYKKAISKCKCCDSILPSSNSEDGIVKCRYCGAMNNTYEYIELEGEKIYD